MATFQEKFAAWYKSVEGGYYHGEIEGMKAPHEVVDWEKLYAIAKSAANGEVITPVCYAIVPENYTPGKRPRVKMTPGEKKLVSGSHRIAAVAILKELGYDVELKLVKVELEDWQWEAIGKRGDFFVAPNCPSCPNCDCPQDWKLS